MSNASTDKHGTGCGLPPRVIFAAALLSERCQNPDVAAYNRARGGGRFFGGRYIVAPSTKRRQHFWHAVGCALGAAYGRRGCPTNYERAVRDEIDAARNAIAQAAGAA